MENAKELIEKLTPQQIQRAIGVSYKSVHWARANNIMPAKWYVGIKSMCDALNIECDPSFFSFKPARDHVVRANNSGEILTPREYPPRTLTAAPEA